MTNASGLVETDLTDTLAETVTVHASVAAGTVPADTDVTFTVGSLDPAASDFIVYRSAGNSDPSKVRADGVESWTGEFIPKDAGGNVITDPLPPSITSAFTMDVDSAVSVVKTATDYTWLFTSHTYDTNYLVKLYVGSEQVAPSTTNTISFTRAVPPEIPLITEPAEGDWVNTATPTVAGVDGEPGSTITVKDEDGNVLCTTTAGADGSWSCTVTTPFDEGVHSLVVTATDSEGNESNASDPITIVVKTTPPDAPVITEPAEGDWVNTDTPTVAGENGEPGSTITVKDEDGNVLCTTTAGADGSWSCTPTSPLPEGEHTLSVTATDPAGNESEVSDPVTITVKTTPPRKPIVNKPEKPFGIDDPVVITGSGEEEGNDIIVRDENGDVVCSTKVGPAPDFAWSCELPAQPDDGVHQWDVVEKDKAGNESESVTVEVEVITVPPSDPVVDPTNGSKVTGTADPDTTVTVTDQDGQPVPGCENIKPDSTGRFECVPDIVLAPGDTITIIATDRAGNKSKPVVVTISALGIAVTHPQRYRGEEQVVTGYSFNPGEKVDLVIYSDPFNAGSSRANADGTVTITFLVPQDMEYTTHTATLTGEQSGSVSTTFEVIAKPVVPTGGTTLPSAAPALALMVLGALSAFTGFSILSRIRVNP
jgi:hypothetical protein